MFINHQPNEERTGSLEPRGGVSPPLSASPTLPPDTLVNESLYPRVERGLDPLDLQRNVTQALELSRAERKRMEHSGKTEGLHNQTVAAFLLGLSAANLTLYPPWTLEAPLANGLAALCGGVGILSAFHASQILKATKTETTATMERDTITSTAELTAADLLYADAPTAEKLLTAAQLYSRHLDNAHGAQAFARGLIGFINCLERLGFDSPAAAHLLAALDGEISTRYSNLPGIKTLTSAVLTSASVLSEHLTEPEDRISFARVVSKLVREGGRENSQEAERSAVRLYDIARSLRPLNHLMRLELLETAHRVTAKTDGIRENIEAQIREIEAEALTFDRTEWNAVRKAMKRLSLPLRPPS